MCISVDYCLVPRAELEAVIALAMRFMQDAAPAYSHSDAIDMINAGERPLGLYVFGDDESLIERVLDETHSGGVTVNACAVQGALPSLGFGGVGNSHWYPASRSTRMAVRRVLAKMFSANTRF